MNTLESGTCGTQKDGNTEAPINSGLTKAKAYLMTIQRPFLSTLAAISNGKGWETIGGKTVFTGSGLCVPSAYALLDGMHTQIDPTLSAHVWQLDIYFNKEYVGGAGAFYRELFGSHFIFQIMKIPSGESIFIDPTYGQVCFPRAGEFLIIKPELLAQYYQTEAKEDAHWERDPMKRPVEIEDLKEVTNEKETQIEYLEKEKVITRGSYNLLVQSLK